MDKIKEQEYLVSSNYALKFSEKFIYSCILINGGAAIAMLPFIGSLFNKLSCLGRSFSACSLGSFAVGLLFAVLTFFFASQSQGKNAASIYFDFLSKDLIKNQPTQKEDIKVDYKKLADDLLNFQLKSTDSSFKWKQNVTRYSICSMISFIMGVGFAIGVIIWGQIYL